MGKESRAKKSLGKLLKEDPDLFYAYQANIAMAIYDEYRRQRTLLGRIPNNTQVKYICNQGAMNFLNLLCK